MLSSKRAGVQADLHGDDVSDLKNTIIELPGVICDECIDARNLTSFCIGGKVNYLITINNPESISPLLSSINKLDIDIFPLGAGTNMLVSDDGFNGVLLKLGDNFRKIERLSDTSINAGGAVKISEFISYIKDNKLGGLTFLSGIPGTVGGAVAMNAGAFGGEIKDRILNVHAVSIDGTEHNFEKEECQFEYRNSIILKERILVLDVDLKVIPGISIEKEIEGYITHRQKNHTPKGKYAGSIFKNPEGNYAGKLLDDSGMKGLRIGGAYVSEKHANFILAEDDCKASDVLELMRIGALRTFTFYGIKLVPEIKLIGFDFEWDEIFN